MNRRFVLFVATGSPGNIRPMLAAARACTARGLPAICASNPLWERWIRSHGVQWRALPQHVEAHITHGARYPDTSEGQVRRSSVASLRMALRDRMERDSARQAFHILIEDVALVVHHATLQRIRGLSEAVGVPALGVSRTGTMSLPPRERRSPSLYAAAPAFLGADVVQSPLEKVCGEWLLPTDSTLPAPLDRFVRVNQPYIIVTHGAFLGSAASHVARTAVVAAHGLGMRVLALMPSDTTYLQSNPETLVWHYGLHHDAVIAGAACVVHPGGAGTTHRSARAGVPSLPIPLHESDVYWAERAFRVQLTSTLLDSATLSVATVSDALAHTTTNVTYRYNSRALALQMAQEHGLEQLIAVIRPYLGSP